MNMLQNNVFSCKFHVEFKGCEGSVLKLKLVQKLIHFFLNLLRGNAQLLYVEDINPIISSHELDRFSDSFEGDSRPIYTNTPSEAAVFFSLFVFVGFHDQNWAKWVLSQKLNAGANNT